MRIPGPDKGVLLAVCCVRQRHLLRAGAQGGLPRAALLKGARKLRDRHKAVRPRVVRPVLLQGDGQSASDTGPMRWCNFHSRHVPAAGPIQGVSAEQERT